MNYKIGDKIKVKEWFNEYEGIITKIGKSIIFFEANGHKHWKHIDTKGEIIGE